MRFLLIGLAAAALVTTALAANGPAPIVSFSVVPRGWHVAHTANGAYALNWREGRSGWANSMPKNGIAVEVFFPRQTSHYPALKPTLPKRPATTLEGAPDTPQYRIHGRIKGRDVEIWVSIRRPHPTNTQLRTAQRVIDGIRFVSTTPSQSATPPAAGCTKARTRTLVNRFVAAFNRGDQRTINNLWASKVWFKWYSVTTEPGARTPQDSVRRDKLLPYLATRHSANEQLSITTLKINGVSGGGYQNFEFRLMRSADDLPGGAVAYIGKGASTCSSGRLIVWVMNAAQ